MATFYIKKNDTSPSLVYVLRPTTVDLTGADVVFNMRASDRTMKISRAPAVIVIESGTPTVRYDWQTGDTDTAGQFLFEFEVTYSSGAIETFRNDGYDTVLIREDLA